jgi:hypothetical protein
VEILRHLKNKAVVLKRINQCYSAIVQFPPEAAAKIFQACIPEIAQSKEDLLSIGRCQM